MAKQYTPLIRLLYRLKNKLHESVAPYYIPDFWNTWGYQGEELKTLDNGELIVNPYRFYHDVIETYILKERNPDLDYTKPYQQLLGTQTGGDWIRGATVYSMLVRASSAWDHDKNGELDLLNGEGFKETGTFVKTLALLPLLKRLGVTALYLLPVTLYSERDKKGELGSVYGVKNFFAFDPHLKDPITGDDFTVEEEFAALVEACHILGIRVLIDFIPRTNAIESDFVIDHPEWFYWIKSEHIEDYRPPRVPSVGFTAPTKDVLPKIYESEEVWEHIRKFTYDPKTLDPDKYERLRQQYKANPQGYFSDLIKREFKVQVAPAFADMVNDPQPPWTDITFFRLYLDHPVESEQELRKHLKEGETVPPYILYDTIKCNLYQGRIPNKELWETLSDVIPYYQRHFGIDGARIDMGHALPKELLDLIMKKARAIDPEFTFIAEELSNQHAADAKDKGYNIIVGSGAFDIPRYETFNLHQFILSAHDLPLPVFASGETHDTPRLVSRKGGRALSKLVTILNYFIPNAVPFINSGQEVFEIAPINTGLDVQENARELLAPDDPFYGKLALFDKYAFHYLNDGRWEFLEQIEGAVAVRKAYLNLLLDWKAFVPVPLTEENVQGIGWSYTDGDLALLIVANTDPTKDNQLTFNLSPVFERLNTDEVDVQRLYSLDSNPDSAIVFNHHFSLNFRPGEVQIYKLQKKGGSSCL